MSMSRDRIEFTLTAGHFSPSNPKRETEQGATIRAAMRAFGFSYEAARDYLHSETVLRCRPSQFGRFIAYRVEEGMTNNRISCLNVRTIPAVPDHAFVDVSRREHSPSVRGSDVAKAC